MRFPDFLIIGAMKAGTTTMYRDLLLNPAIFMPINKEPSNLTRDEVLTTTGRAEYAELFSRALPSQIIGEASTNYTKLPDYPNVPRRALATCGERLRLIYVIREPLARIISHHYHGYSSRRFSANINEELYRSPQLIAYTSYAMQIRPWIETFGREQVMIIRFEDYVRNRKATVESVSRFLGVEPRTDEIDEQAIYNRSDKKPVRLPFWKKVRKSSFYRRNIQRYLPVNLRDRMRELVFPKAPDRPGPPSLESIDFIYAQLADDLDALRELLGEREPIWDIPTARDDGAPRTSGRAG